MENHYRIVDLTDDEILANGIPDPDIALETLDLLRQQYPNNALEIESYPSKIVK